MNTPSARPLPAVAAALLLSFLAAAAGPRVLAEETAADAAAEAAGGTGAPPVAIELNRAEDIDGACRIYLVTSNGLDVPLDPFTLDFVAFDGEGVVLTRLAVDLAPVPPAKTMVRLFDVAGAACQGISALLLNDVVACGAGPHADRACLDLLSVSSRAGIDLRL